MAGPLQEDVYHEPPWRDEDELAGLVPSTGRLEDRKEIHRYDAPVHAAALPARRAGPTRVCVWSGRLGAPCGPARRAAQGGRQRGSRSRVGGPTAWAVGPEMMPNQSCG